MKIGVFKNVFADGKFVPVGEELNVNQKYYELLRERLKIKKVVEKN